MVTKTILILAGVELASRQCRVQFQPVAATPAGNGPKAQLNTTTAPLISHFFVVGSYRPPLEFTFNMIFFRSRRHDPSARWQHRFGLKGAGGYAVRVRSGGGGLLRHSPR
ncbi:unnamed protein product [Protopolystoma xenopodis]|uniref:Uncharacterized protein n=1 Tax=Protopolystoma xenopodis TaxID=117903 RepID=A0A448X0W4_9PLAT|nr:unnamed protein product [Protopolystoma xenopodis]